VIGKVLRGTDARRLLYYLYGAGKATEHTDPHLMLGSATQPGWLEPGRRVNGSRDFRAWPGCSPARGRAEWIGLPRAGVALRGPRRPGDRPLSGAEWAEIAAAIMDRVGPAPAGDDLAVRWVAVRHASDHIHLVATLVRQEVGAGDPARLG